MDVDTALDVLRRESGLLAVAAGPALDRTIPQYPEWTGADLVVHTGRIHRWVTQIVRTTAAEPVPKPTDEPDRAQTALTDWFMSGAADLAMALAETAAATRVWSFSSDRTVGFWRRRMALETTIHRWDAQSATATPQPVAADVAAEGVTEALHVYMLHRLRGLPVDGEGRRIALHATDTGQRWSLRLLADGIDIGDPEGDDPAAATIAGTAEGLWLYLMGRRSVDTLTTRGDATAVRACTRAVDLVPPAQR